MIDSTEMISGFIPVALSPTGARADNSADWLEVERRGIRRAYRTAVDEQAYAINVDSHKSGISRASLVTPTAISVNWSRLSRASLSLVTYTRLFELAARPDGWRGPGSRALDSSSLSSFLGFWTMVSAHASEPQFTLSPNGHLGAEWYKSSRRNLDLEFTDDQKAFFGLFQGAEEIEGIAAVTSIAAMLLAHPARPLDWTSR